MSTSIVRGPLRSRAHAPQLALGGEAGREQRLGAKRRLPRDTAFRNQPCGGPPTGSVSQSELRRVTRKPRAASRSEGALDRGLAIAQVGAETEKDRRAHVPSIIHGAPPGATGV